MHQYYHPSSEPIWVNDDWLKQNTPWDPETTPVSTLADNGFFELQLEEPDPKLYSPLVYYSVWDYRIEFPYCIQYALESLPFPLEEAKDNMQANYSDHSAEIEAATTSEELQAIYNSLT